MDCDARATDKEDCFASVARDITLEFAQTLHSFAFDGQNISNSRSVTLMKISSVRFDAHMSSASLFASNRERDVRDASRRTCDRSPIRFAPVIGESRFAGEIAFPAVHAD